RTLPASRPHGADATHNATIRASRSDAKEVIRSGFPGLTTRARVLPAKGAARPLRSPALATALMEVASAVAKTSAGAPWMIWSPRLDDDPKLNVNWTAGCAASKRFARLEKTVDSEEAAETTIVPCRASPAGGLPEGLALVVPHAAGPTITAAAVVPG